MKPKREHMIPWLATTVALFLTVCGSVVMAVAREPLGTVPPGALVMDQDWHGTNNMMIPDANDAHTSAPHARQPLKAISE
jgi:hypothetical protein